MYWDHFYFCASIYSQGQSAQTRDNSNFERINVTSTTAPFPESSFLTTEKKQSRFVLVQNGQPASVLVSESDHSGVRKIAGLFQKDLSRVSGQEAELTVGGISASENLVIVGTGG